MRGVVPACRTQDAVSIFALTVADAREGGDDRIAFDEEDAFRAQRRAALRRRRGAGTARSACRTDRSPFFGDEDYEALYQRGHRPAGGARRRDRPDRLRALRARRPRCSMPGRGWPSALPPSAILPTRNPEAIHEVVRAIILGAKDKSAVDAFQAFYELAELVRAAEAESGRRWTCCCCRPRARPTRSPRCWPTRSRSTPISAPTPIS